MRNEDIILLVIKGRYSPTQSALVIHCSLSNLTGWVCCDIAKRDDRERIEQQVEEDQEVPKRKAEGLLY